MQGKLQGINAQKFFAALLFSQINPYKHVPFIV